MTEKYVDAPDTGGGDVGTYSQRVNECGCRSVPDGQHISGCLHQRVADVAKEAERCTSCGYRGVHTAGVCPFCGAGNVDTERSRVGIKRGDA